MWEICRAKELQEQLTIEVVKENRTKKTGHTGTLALGFSSDMHLTIHVTQNNDMERYPV